MQSPQQFISFSFSRSTDYPSHGPASSGRPPGQGEARLGLLWIPEMRGLQLPISKGLLHFHAFPHWYLCGHCPILGSTPPLEKNRSVWCWNHPIIRPDRRGSVPSEVSSDIFSHATMQSWTTFLISRWHTSFLPLCLSYETGITGCRMRHVVVLRSQF